MRDLFYLLLEYPRHLPSFCGVLYQMAKNGTSELREQLEALAMAIPWLAK